MPDPSMIAGAVQGVIGSVQSIIGGIQARKAQKKLEGLVNSYQPNASIGDYYQKALSRYNASPYNSALYRMQNQNAQRNLSTGISSLQGRRSALAGITNLVQATNDANLKAVSGAEGQQAQALSQLGGATAMKAQEDYKPFELKYNLQAMKASGGNQIMNAGLSNLYGGISAIGDYAGAKQVYGTNGGNAQNPNQGKWWYNGQG